MPLERDDKVKYLFDLDLKIKERAQKYVALANELCKRKHEVFMEMTLCLFFLIVLGMMTDAEGTLVDVKVDWEKFLRRHDIVWEQLPDRFDHGVWHGNGLLGTVIYMEEGNVVRWELGRSDITERRRDNSRLLIGGMVLEPVGEIKGGMARYDLWNAESSGTIETTKGTIKFRTFIHSTELVIIVELECSSEEEAAIFNWLPWPHVDSQNNDKFGDPPNPEPFSSQDGDVSIHVQPRYAGGEFATAWQEVRLEEGKRRLYISISDTFPDSGAGKKAAASVRKAVEIDIDTLRDSHRRWWHAYYPKSFVSVPDGKIEGFYWIQIHKLACATRQDRPVMDLLGPWFRATSWPRIWWNLNIQTAYLSVYTANHLEIGLSLTRMLDQHRENFYKNAKDIWGMDNCATVPHTTCYEGLRGDGDLAPDHFINPGDFTWALHNYYLQYRYSMNHSMVTDQDKYAFYPLLRDSVNLYLNLMFEGGDGRYHLPSMHSPEYGQDSNNNYNLSLLRWACQTLIDLNTRYELKDPLVPKWQDVLDNLVAYPVDENGLRIGAEMSATKSHRHWSHMLMVHPLRTMNWEQEENRELMRKSVDFWLTVEGGHGLMAWSYAAAASLYAGMHDGDKAEECLNKHHDNRNFVMPNGMYIEGSPVIECALVAGRSLHDMLLQSWGGKLRVFPAMPEKWAECSFHDLRGEGAFLVSAQRSEGKTKWIRVKSLAGEPCVVVHGMGKTPLAMSGTGSEVKVTDLGKGAIELALQKGEEVLLYSGDAPKVQIEPVAIDDKELNYWGVKEGSPGVPPARKKLTSVLSSHKPAKASSTWSDGYSPEKAFDDDTGTRWGAKANSRSGWLEVDLGKETQINKVVIMEIEFPRTEQYRIEVKEGDVWKTVAEGKKLGGIKTIALPDITARYVRLNILKANEVPTLEEFRVLGPEE